MGTVYSLVVPCDGYGVHAQQGVEVFSGVDERHVLRDRLPVPHRDRPDADRRQKDGVGCKGRGMKHNGAGRMSHAIFAGVSKRQGSIIVFCPEMGQISASQMRNAERQSKEQTRRQ